MSVMTVFSKNYIINSFSCSITKEAKYDIWWKFDEEYYYLQKNDDDTTVFKKLNADSGDIDSALITENKDGWSVAEDYDPKTLGLLIRQVCMQLDSYIHQIDQKPFTLDSKTFI